MNYYNPLASDVMVTDHLAPCPRRLPSEVWILQLFILDYAGD